MSTLFRLLLVVNQLAVLVLLPLVYASAQNTFIRQSHTDIIT